MNSLQNKIFAFFVLLLLLVQAIAFATLYTTNKSQEELEIRNRLDTATTVFNQQFNSRRFYLAAFAETAAKDFGLKQLFDEDTRSLLVALNNHRKRIEADMAIAINADQRIIGQLLNVPVDDNQYKVRRGPEQGMNFRFGGWLEQVQAARLYQLGDDVYQLSLSPLKSGAKVIGWLGFGYRIDRRLARQFASSTGLNTDFLMRRQDTWQLIASSSDQPDLQLSRQIINNQVPESYIAIDQQVFHAGAAELRVTMHVTRDELTQVLREGWWKLLVLAAITLMTSLACAYLIAAGISRPIKRLVKQAQQVAQGDYHQPVVINENNELGQLASEFNQMQEAVISREKAIAHRAYHDPMTDLPNRNRLITFLSRFAEAEQSRFCVMHLNICRVNDINDILGHDIGDQVIKEVANRLVQLDDVDQVCHLGADEFILLCDRTSAAELPDKLKTIAAAFERTCEYQGIDLHLQVRIGVAFFPEHQDDPVLLLQKAENALQQAKRNRSDFQIYDASQNINSVERLSLINDLKHAIDGDQLVLFYQPKLNCKAGRITQVEALVRWQHPTLGMVPPDRFIQIAEQTGQINALTRWVFLEALRQYQAWQAQGLSLSIAINISAENLKDEQFYDFICSTLIARTIPAKAITLEVTESALVDDPAAAIALLARFKAFGLHLSIDDYGTGYSSLAQLKQLPVHELKIDKSFVQKLQHDDDDKIIVRSTIEMAHNMGLSVVAEGIEDQYALQWLADHHCELAQGYYISRPQPADSLTPWLLEPHDFFGTTTTIK